MSGLTSQTTIHLQARMYRQRVRGPETPEPLHEYVLTDLVNHKKRSVHVKNLKIFNYDPDVDIPADTARRDYMEFVVEKVLGHAGDTKKPTTMSFHVKWLNYDDSHNTWEPWKSQRLCEALHDYLRDEN